MTGIYPTLSWSTRFCALFQKDRSRRWLLYWKPKILHRNSSSYHWSHKKWSHPPMIKKKKKKDLALMVLTASDDCNDDKDEEIAFLSQQWFLTRKKECTTKTSENDTNDGLRCYKYKKLGHMMVNFPLLKAKPKNFKRKKAMCASWDESEKAILKKIQKTKKLRCALWLLNKMSKKQIKMG